MTGPGSIVGSFFERMQARAWDAAAEPISPTAEIEFTATGERFDGAGFMRMNRDYPEGWTLSVEEILAEGDRVAAQVRVTQDGRTFRCVGFYTVRGGVIVSGVENWLTEGADEPPAWRLSYGGGTPCRADALEAPGPPSGG